MSQKYWIHFRASEQLSEALDAWCEERGVTRSAGARILLQMALGDDADNAVASQAIYELNGVLEGAMRQAINEAVERLPDILRERMAE